MAPSSGPYDVIVAGLGAMGSSAAYHLAQRGARVLGLDAFAPGHTNGSSHGETRIIRLSYFEHPDYVPLLRRAYQLWQEAQTEVGETLFLVTGGIYIGPPNGELVAGATRSAREHRLAHHLLGAAEVRRSFRELRPADGDSALFEPQAGILFPERCIAAHQTLAAARGAELRHSEPLLRWDPDGDGVRVVTERHVFRAAKLVLTAGAWMPRLLGPAVPLPLRVERNVVFWLRPPGLQRFSAPAFPIFIWETPQGHFYGLPHVRQRGVKVALHHTGQYGDPDTIDREVRQEDEAPVRQFVRAHIPRLDGPVESSLVCLYTLTPDGHFVIDSHPAHPQVVFASACSGHGFKFASVVGEILADLALTGRAAPAAEFLRLARLQTPKP
ncbi:MAG TPA: N-methyl-L-tryptophan oxidase [Chloroflexota bacterium]|nr:N-methyl-L-tryptophan oxidase [Chloroflexota bacterium]